MAKQTTSAVQAKSNEAKATDAGDENLTKPTEQTGEQQEVANAAGDAQAEHETGPAASTTAEQPSQQQEAGDVAASAAATPASGADPEEGEGETMRMMVAEQVLVVSAPGGPRRRAGFSFGPVPVDLRWDDLGATDEEREDALERLRADPMLKIDGRLEERPADD